MALIDKLDRVEYLLKHQPGRHDQQRHDPHKGLAGDNAQLKKYVAANKDMIAKAVYDVGEELYGTEESGFLHGPDPEIEITGVQQMLKNKKKVIGSEPFSDMVYDADENLDEVNLMDDTWEYSVLYDPNSKSAILLKPSDYGMNNGEVLDAYRTNPEKIVVTYEAVTNTMRVVPNTGKSVQGTIKYKKQNLTAMQRQVRRNVRVGDELERFGRKFRVSDLINDPYTGDVRVQATEVGGAETGGIGIFEWEGSELIHG